jgi:LAO/AO transport system kinase
MSRKEIDVDALGAALVAGDVGALSRSITLIESTLPEDRTRATRLLAQIHARTGDAVRLGISGVPGVGKSTFIEALGTHLVAGGAKVAVLAVDPTSTRSGGSILGDKTRMQQLAHHPQAFIRPSPTSGALGGVAATTRESILLCEAAGFDVVLVETVGVGQSEITVAGMVDCFLVLMLAGAGDELQGIKRGILELVDVLAINKSDGENEQPSKLAAAEYRRALRLMGPRTPGWIVPVQNSSALSGAGIPELWGQVLAHREHLVESGFLEQQRAAQELESLEKILEAGLMHAMRRDSAVQAKLDEMMTELRAGTVTPRSAAERVLASFLSRE